MHAGWPWWAAILVGVASSCLAGLVIGYLAIRTRGIYFSMVTLALARIVNYLFYKADGWTIVILVEHKMKLKLKLKLKMKMKMKMKMVMVMVMGLCKRLIDCTMANCWLKAILKKYAVTRKSGVSILARTERPPCLKLNNSTPGMTRAM